MTDKYFEEFLDEEPLTDEIIPSNELPDWVSAKNSSLIAYQAINTLKKNKARYINGHNKKREFKKKLLYQISKVEVADKINKTPQSIFRMASYSEELVNYFDNANNVLNDKVKGKIERKKHGIQHQSKDELKSRTRNLSEELNNLKKENCEELYRRLLSNMPLDLKKNLGLK